jgi:predicted glycoside hydrolase/deacetylase ChbG (UPF0249 family)
MKYFFQERLQKQLKQEIGAQFARFRSTGLKLDHVNGHLHLHLHPTIFSILLSKIEPWGITSMRLTRDPFWLNAKLAGGAWLSRAAHACIYLLLAARARRALKQHNVRFTPLVFGLLQNGRVTRDYLFKLLSHLPCGDSEVYSHPSLHEPKNEFEALVSPSIKQLVRERDIKLIRYQDL